MKDTKIEDINLVELKLDVIAELVIAQAHHGILDIDLAEDVYDAHVMMVYKFSPLKYREHYIVQKHLKWFAHTKNILSTIKAKRIAHG